MLILLENFGVFLTEASVNIPASKNCLEFGHCKGFGDPVKKLLGPSLPPLPLASIGEEAINWGPQVKVRKEVIRDIGLPPRTAESLRGLIAKRRMTST